MLVGQVQPLPQLALALVLVGQGQELQALAWVQELGQVQPSSPQLALVPSSQPWELSMGEYKIEISVEYGVILVKVNRHVTTNLQPSWPPGQPSSLQQPW